MIDISDDLKLEEYCFKCYGRRQETECEVCHGTGY